jgi:phage-related holin
LKEILKEVFSKINVNQTLKAVTDKDIEKLAASAVGATLLDIGTIFLLLMLLEIIDIFTACVYQASLLYKATYDRRIVEKRGSLLTYIKYIWQAHHWRYVDSYALRDGFCSKTIIYSLLLITGFVIDIILSVSHAPIQPALTIVCCVLSITEGISICENLDSAGIKMAGEIRALLQKRKEGIK